MNDHIASKQSSDFDLKMYLYNSLGWKWEITGRSNNPNPCSQTG